MGAAVIRRPEPQKNVEIPRSSCSAFRQPPIQANMSPDDKARLKDLDRRLVWHPFTQMRTYAREDPIVIARADGVYLEDIDGNRYLDGYSSMWCNVHGHRVEDIDDAIRKQLDQVAHSTLLGLSNIPAIRLAEKLVQITPPGLNRVFYSDTGACAVEIALKIAFQYWRQKPDPKPGKTSFLSLAQSYHGDTIGAMSVGNIDCFHKTYGPLLFPSLNAPAPHPYRCTFCAREKACNQGCLRAVEDILRREAHRIAAFIVEPLIQCAGGMLVHPEGYLKGIADLCRAHDVLLIADEIATGFGRTGAMFACEKESVAPDILCLGKGITGGYLPVAATLTTSEIFDAFLGEDSEGRTFFHGHTYTGNPLGCAAALATIERFESQKVLASLRLKIELLARGLPRFRTLAHAGDVRQCGFIAGIELVADRSVGRPYSPTDRIGVRVCGEARKRGLLIRPLGDTIVLMPPLAISDRDLEKLLEIVHASILAVTGPA